MGLYERREVRRDEAGQEAEVTVERAFMPSDRPDRDQEIRGYVEAGLFGWRRVELQEAEEEAPTSPPSKSAVKEEWVAWAVAQGADRGEAEKATKPDLIAAYGAASPDNGQGPGE